MSMLDLSPFEQITSLRIRKESPLYLEYSLFEILSGDRLLFTIVITDDKTIKIISHDNNYLLDFDYFMKIIQKVKDTALEEIDYIDSSNV